jgi:tetratricopeptide (TPR) repeat protein
VKNIFADLFARKPAPSADDNRAKPPREATFKKGDIIGGYVVNKFLGNGGFGEVYLAYIPEQRSVCALKTIRAELLVQPYSREAFKREALLWVNLEQHPFILVARHVFEFSRRLFVGMDYIAADPVGRVSLADHLAAARGPLDTDESLKWAIQFCYGMEHALQRGIKCHRDIKPTNILITQSRTLKITDFGLALAAEAAWRDEARSIVTEKGDSSFGLSLLQADGKRVCGTPGYIAPEILLGKQADERSDIYSFGLVMWQMAKGSSVPPFHVPSHEVANIEEYLRRVFDQQMKKRPPDVKTPMQSAIERCLSTDPAQRYASFEELRRELGAIFLRRTGKVVELPKGTDRTAGFWKNKGVSLDELENHEEAIRCYDKALEIEPRDVNTWSNKGIALGEMGRHEAALACFDKALEFDPNSGMAWNNRGHLLELLNRHEAAIASFDMAIRCYQTPVAQYHKALGVNPESAMAWDGKGQALYALNRYQDALECFAAAARINPRYANAWKGQFMALAKLGRSQEAGTCSKKAAEIDPQWEDDLRRLSAARGDHDMALASFKPDATKWNGQGTTLARASRYDDALDCFAKALEIDPRFGAAWYNRGGAFTSLGRRQEALACYTEVLQIDPEFFDAWESKAHTLALLDRYEEAVTCFTRALELNPQSVACWNNKGKSLEALGRDDEAIGCFTRALELDPSRAVIWDNKAVSLRRVARYEEALACSTKALETEPGNPYFWSNKGAALYEVEKPEDAVQCYARAVEIDPHYAGAWNNKGIALALLGRLDEAVGCFDRALQIDPNFKSALDNRRKAVEIAHPDPEVTDEDIPF